ncbi:MAG: HAD-IIA family hydrolase [Promethearchaeota archaeon]
MFDLDGTVYKGTEVIPGASRVISELQKQGKQVFLLTNNATKSRASFVEKLGKMNIHVSEEQVISSGYITALALARNPNISTVFVIGTTELVKMIEDAGVQTVNSQYDDAQLSASVLDSSITCDAVLTSLDREITYPKIRTAMELINRGATFHATNSDSTFPEEGQLCPGGGVMLAAVQTSVGFPPKEIFGKPNTLGLEMIFNFVKDKGCTLDDMVLIGDRFETDIFQANRMGIESVYVDTGVNSPEDLDAIEDPVQKKNYTPTWFKKSIKELLE